MAIFFINAIQIINGIIFICLIAFINFTNLVTINYANIFKISLTVSSMDLLSTFTLYCA